MFSVSFFHLFHLIFFLSFLRNKIDLKYLTATTHRLEYSMNLMTISINSREKIIRLTTFFLPPRFVCTSPFDSIVDIVIWEAPEDNERSERKKEKKLNENRPVNIKSQKPNKQKGHKAKTHNRTLCRTFHVAVSCVMYKKAHTNGSVRSFVFFPLFLNSL